MKGKIVENCLVAHSKNKKIVVKLPEEVERVIRESKSYNSRYDFDNNIVSAYLCTIYYYQRISRFMEPIKYMGDCEVVFIFIKGELKAYVNWYPEILSDKLFFCNEIMEITMNKRAIKKYKKGLK